MLCVFVCCLVSLQRPEYRLSQSPRLVRKQSVSSFNFTSKASPSTFCVLVHVLSPCHSRSRVVAIVVFVLLLRDSLSRGFVLLASELSVCRVVAAGLFVSRCSRCPYRAVRLRFPCRSRFLLPLVQPASSCQLQGLAFLLSLRRVLSLSVCVSVAETVVAALCCRSFLAAVESMSSCRFESVVI